MGRRRGVVTAFFDGVVFSGWCYFIGHRFRHGPDPYPRGPQRFRFCLRCKDYRSPHVSERGLTPEDVPYTKWIGHPPS